MRVARRWLGAQPALLGPSTLKKADVAEKTRGEGVHTNLLSDRRKKTLTRSARLDWSHRRYSLAPMKAYRSSSCRSHGMAAFGSANAHQHEKNL